MTLKIKKLLFLGRESENELKTEDNIYLQLKRTSYHLKIPVIVIDNERVFRGLVRK